MTKIIPPVLLPWYHRSTIGQVMGEFDMRKEVTADSLVQQVVELYPQTIPTFNRLGMLCVGCFIAPHHTIADCAREYALSTEYLLDELNQVLLAEAV
jgi:hybrid cluster-associated redox disulfide protein